MAIHRSLYINQKEKEHKKNSSTTINYILRPEISNENYSLYLRETFVFSKKNVSLTFRPRWGRKRKVYKCKKKV